MLALIQRVSSAKVEVESEIVAEIQQGLLVFLGVERDDSQSQVDSLVKKIINYRVFTDSEDKMNLSVADINGGLLIVSQFTLAANTDKGLRPSFSRAKPPQEAELIYDYFVEQALKLHPIVGRGQFGADMAVSLVNDGPATFILR